MGEAPRRVCGYTLSASTRDGADHRPDRGTGAGSPESPACGPPAPGSKLEHEFLSLSDADAVSDDGDLCSSCSS